MSCKGNPHDNALAESFIKTLKSEEVYLNEYRNLHDAKNNIEVFIEYDYNQKRLHSSIGYRPPVEYEAKYSTGMLKSFTLNVKNTVSL
jgi:putative transposase